MRKVWLVAKHEYLKLVRKRSFLLTTLGIPFLIVAMIAFGIVSSLGSRGDLPIGYIDDAGVLAPGQLPPLEEGEKIVTFQSFADVTAARAALEQEEIAAYYYLPEDYLNSGYVELTYLRESPGELVQDDFRAFLRANLLAQQPQEVQERILNGTNLTIRSADSSREFDTRNIFNFFVPFIAAFFFIIAVMSAAGYMLQAITDEKENRTIEVLTTSLRPMQLIGGKTLGLIGVGLTQLLLWLLTGVVGLVIAARFIEGLRNLSLPWSTFGVMAAFFLPAYVLISAMMIAIGSAVTELRQGQQIAGILNLMFSLPFFFLALIMSQPNHPLVVFLSLFPTTAFITVIMRWAIAGMPVWQLIASWVLLVATAIAGVWVAARVFRVGMLRYGQQLKLAHVWAAVRGEGRKYA